MPTDLHIIVLHTETYEHIERIVKQKTKNKTKKPKNQLITNKLNYSVFCTIKESVAPLPPPPPPTPTPDHTA